VSPAQRTALSIYLVCMAMLLAMVFFFIAPFLAKVSGLALAPTTRVLLALTALAGGWTAVTILRAPDPLGRLSKIISARPNSGSQGSSSQPAEDPGPAVPATTPRAESGRKAIVPK